MEDRLIETAGIEVTLVGDSLGNVIQGRDSTIPVTIDEMAYHTQIVKRGNSRTLLMTDMPFMTYATENQAMDNAAILMQAGAQMVKLDPPFHPNSTKPTPRAHRTPLWYAHKKHVSTTRGQRTKQIERGSPTRGVGTSGVHDARGATTSL